MTFGNQNTEAEAHEQLSYAFDMGINILDTAEVVRQASAAPLGDAASCLTMVPARGRWVTRTTRLDPSLPTFSVQSNLHALSSGQCPPTLLTPATCLLATSVLEDAIQVLFKCITCEIVYGKTIEEFIFIGSLSPWAWVLNAAPTSAGFVLARNLSQPLFPVALKPSPPSCPPSLHRSTPCP